ncbi:MAG TPA: FG-GAP repeat protein [Candidatus Kapabacteria bacterium]|nr:FG-GAP repeat protein [Candidatus Kapabacteria bacterium]
MKYIQKHRILLASLFILAVTVLASNSFAALNAYMVFKGQTNGKTYKATPDADGKFTFSNVDSGMYSLILVIDAAGNAPPSAEKKKSDEHPKSIELMSFSWGATNAGARITNRPQGSNAQLSSASKTGAPASPTFTPDVVGQYQTRVATGDLNGDGIPDVIVSSVTATIDTHSADASQVSTVILQNVLVTSACSPTGKVTSRGWDIKANTK